MLSLKPTWKLKSFCFFGQFSSFFRSVSGIRPETDQNKAEKIPEKSGILSFKVSSQTAKEAAHFFEIVGLQNTAIQSCYQSISVFIYV